MKLLPEIRTTKKDEGTGTGTGDVRYTNPQPVPQTLGGVYTAAKDNVLLQILLDKIKVAAKVELGNSDVIQGVGLLTQMGILTEERAATILQG